MANPSPIVPCLWLDDQAEAAARLYTELFPNGRVGAVCRYPESFDNPARKPRGSVVTVDFEIAGQRFTALNGGPQFEINPSISFFVHVDGPDAVDRLLSPLAEGGKTLMKVGKYPWSERYGWVQDRFGVSWQVIAGRREGSAMVAPCLMFGGVQRGRAEEAIGHYTRVFDDGKICVVDRYPTGEGPQGAEGTVRHGRFLIAGQDMVAMDSHIDHPFTFDEGLSFQVMCNDQATVDRYWEALADGGEEGPCGWVKDRFGLSWQVVPARLTELLASEDGAANDRAFQAMLRMKKLDIATIEAAAAGR